MFMARISGRQVTNSKLANYHVGDVKPTLNAAQNDGLLVFANGQEYSENGLL